MKIKIIYKLILISSILTVIFLIPFLPVHLFTTFLRLVLIFILIIEISLIFKEFIFDSKFKAWLKNLGTGILSIVIILLLLESFFMFVPKSHGVGYTLACKLWFKKYWNPINSYNFRDVEPVPKQSNIFFIGDSFVAGHGIKKIKDRFSDIVREKLLEKNKNIQSINLGRDGLDTRKEYEIMEDFINSSNINPDIIVLQYYGNDIEFTAVRNGFDWVGPSPYQGLNPILRNVIKGSYLVNYFYWLFPKYDVMGYLTFLEDAYKNEIVFKEHIQDINRFIEYSKQKNIPLLVVIFPFLQDIELSNKLFVNKLRLFFDDKGVKYIDVSELAKDLSLKKRVVNLNDGHASILVNRLVGEEIYKYIFQIFSEKK